MLGVFCRRWGVPLIDGGTVRLPRIVGLGRALDLILTGRPVPAAEALAMGLVSRVVPAGEARRRGGGAGPRTRRRCPRPACAATAQSTLEGLTLPEDAAMANEFRHGMSALAAPGLAEEIGRFTGGAGRGGAPPELCP